MGTYTVFETFIVSYTCILRTSLFAAYVQHVRERRKSQRQFNKHLFVANDTCISYTHLVRTYLVRTKANGICVKKEKANGGRQTFIAWHTYRQKIYTHLARTYLSNWYVPGRMHGKEQKANGSLTGW